MRSLADFWEFSLLGAKRNGAQDGSRNIPNKTQTDHAPYEKQLAMRANRGIRKVTIDWEKADQELKGRYVSALREFIDAQKSAQKEADEAEDWLKKQRDILDRLNMTEKPHLGKFAYRCIIGLIAIGEIPLTAQVFEVFGENKILTYIFALVLCVAIPTTSHFVGMGLKEKFHGKTLGIVMVLGTITITTLGYISWLREKFFESGMQQLLGVEMDPNTVTMVFFFIQLLIFVMAVTASYFAHDGHPDRKTLMTQLNSANKDLVKEAGEAKAAEQRLLKAAKELAIAESLREKTYTGYRSTAEQIIEENKMIIESYRAANVRARADAEIASFRDYPNITLGSLESLDTGCGPTIPAPIHCVMCGEENPAMATRCKRCGNNIR